MARLGLRFWGLLGLTLALAYYFAAWALVAGFYVGYIRSKLTFAAVLGAAVATVLGFFTLTASACSGFFAFLTCGLAIFGFAALALPLIVLGAVEGAVGFFLGKWSTGGIGRRRGAANGPAIGALFLMLALLSLVFFVGLTNLSTLPTTSGVSPLVVVVIFAAFGLYFILAGRGRRR